MDRLLPIRRNGRHSQYRQEGDFAGHEFDAVRVDEIHQRRTRRSGRGMHLHRPHIAQGQHEVATRGDEKRHAHDEQQAIGPVDMPQRAREVLHVIHHTARNVSICTNQRHYFKTCTLARRASEGEYTRTIDRRLLPLAGAKG